VGSERRYPAKLPELEYPEGAHLRRVSHHGDVKLNGVQTVTANDGRYPEGRIGLQFNPNSGPIKFRKVRIREL
jgi:hypothetical protein